MLSSKASNPNCMKLWMDWIASPWANAKATESFGEAPSNRDGVRADRRTPTTAPTSTPRTRTTGPTSGTGPRPPRSASTAAPTSTCVPYTEWVNAWNELRGPEPTTPSVAAGGTVHAPRPSAGARVNRLFRERRTLGLFSVLSPTGARGCCWSTSARWCCWSSPPSSRSTLLAETTDDVHARQRRRRASPTRRARRGAAQDVCVAATVTVVCIALALPTAFFVAKIAPPWAAPRADRVDDAAAVGGLPRQDLRLANDGAPAGGNRFAAEGRGGGGVLQSVLGWTPGYSVRRS